MAYSPEKTLNKSVHLQARIDRQRPSSRQSSGNQQRVLRQNIQIMMPEKSANKIDRLALGEMSLNEYLQQDGGSQAGTNDQAQR